MFSSYHMLLIEAPKMRQMMKFIPMVAVRPFFESYAELSIVFITSKWINRHFYTWRRVRLHRHLIKCWFPFWDLWRSIKTQEEARIIEYKFDIIRVLKTLIIILKLTIPLEIFSGWVKLTFMINRVPYCWIASQPDI